MAKTASEINPTSYPKLVSPTGRYVIQQVRTWQGDSVVWWSPKRSGYTFRLDKAGVYSEDEARRIERIRGEDYAVPLEYAEQASSRHVAGQDLRDVLSQVVACLPHEESPTPGQESKP